MRKDNKLQKIECKLIARFELRYILTGFLLMSNGIEMLELDHPVGPYHPAVRHKTYKFISGYTVMVQTIKESIISDFKGGI